MRDQPDLPKTRRLNVETAVVVGLGLGRYGESVSADETAEPSFGSLVLRETGTGREDAKKDGRSSVYLGGLRIKCAPPIFDILQSKEQASIGRHAGALCMEGRAQKFPARIHHQLMKVQWLEHDGLQIPPAPWQILATIRCICCCLPVMK